MKIRTNAAFAAILACTAIFAAKAADPGFHVKNKSGKTIWVAVTNGDDILTKFGGGRKRVDNSKSFGATIDPQKETILGIYTSDPRKVSYTKETPFFGKEKMVIKPKPDYVYTFITGKTAYVKWTPDKKLLPQKGTFYGKTTAGYPLKNNVQPGDIRLKTTR